MLHISSHRLGVSNSLALGPVSYAVLSRASMGIYLHLQSTMLIRTNSDNRAGTFPTFDPSWYGSSPIVLSALEVHLATICASLPVFWPMIKDTWVNKRILVTHEVEITTELREPDHGDLIKTYDTHSLKAVHDSNMKPWEYLDEGYQHAQCAPSLPVGHSTLITEVEPDTPARGGGTPDSGRSLMSRADRMGLRWSEIGARNSREVRAWPHGGRRVRKGQSPV